MRVQRAIKWLDLRVSRRRQLPARPHAATPMASRCAARYAPHACAFRALRKAPIPGAQLISGGDIRRPAPASLCTVSFPRVSHVCHTPAGCHGYVKRGWRTSSRIRGSSDRLAAGRRLPATLTVEEAAAGGGGDPDAGSMQGVLCKEVQEEERWPDSCLVAYSGLLARSVRCSSEVMHVRCDLHSQ